MHLRRHSLIHRFALFCVVMLFGISTPIVRAAPIPLQVELDITSSQSRTTGPCPIHLLLSWPGPDLLEGRLQIIVRDGPTQVCSILSDEMVLNAGQARSSWMIPNESMLSAQLDVQVSWIQDGKPVWSEVRPLRVPGNDHRTFVLAVCTVGNLPPSPVMTSLEQSLTVEKPLGIDEIYGPGRQPIVTMTPRVSARDLPVEPLEYCIYDAVLLDGGVLQEMTAAQRTSLEKWVQAGGAVMIAAPESRWRAGETAFVQSLLSESPDVVISAGSDIGLIISNDDENRFAKAVNGLGRVIVINDGSAIDDSAQEIASFLWRMRSDFEITASAMRRAADENRLDATKPVVAADPYNPYAVQGYGSIGISNTIRRPHQPDLSPLVDDLLPRGVRVVPLWLMGIVFAAYVVLIGPVDYLTLGAIRRRKWTWITFPLITAAVAWGVAELSHAFLSSRGPQREMVFRDIIRGGRVARETRFHVLFESSPGDVRTSMPRGLFTTYSDDFRTTAMLSQAIAMGAVPAKQAMAMGVTEDAEAVAPAFEGRMPHSATVTQTLGQWSPRANRFFTIPLASEEQQLPAGAAAFPWDDFDPDSFDFDSRLRTAVLENFGNEATAIFFRGTNRRSIAGGQEILRRSWDTPQGVFNGLPPGAMRLPNGNLVMVRNLRSPMPGETHGDLLDTTTKRGSGVFQLVSQMSPACDQALEDLPFLDSSDSNQAALVIAVPSDEGWAIYRRLYRKVEGGRWR